VPTVPISTDSSGSSLSTRAVTGIIVSSIIAGVALMLVIVLLMRNRRLNQRFEEKDDIVNPNTSQSWPRSLLGIEKINNITSYYATPKNFQNNQEIRPFLPKMFIKEYYVVTQTIS
jgi:hypothetical protein